MSKCQLFLSKNSYSELYIRILRAFLFYQLPSSVEITSFCFAVVVFATIAFAAVKHRSVFTSYLFFLAFML
jgi:hypothetical protein